MGLRINTNIEAINVHRNLMTTNRNLAESLKRLSSGYRINSAKDDASGFAVANKLKADIASLRIAHQNAAEAQSMLQVADGAYSKIYDILVRMKELATQAASDQTDQSQLKPEFENLKLEINRIARSTKYNQKTLINGGDVEDPGLTFQIGQENNDDFKLTIQLKAADANALGVDVINIDNADNARNAMNAIDNAIEKINERMSNIGANQNRLQYIMENLEISIENFSASESTIRDVDMADEVTRFTKFQILQQYGIAMLAQANMAPQRLLQLLG